jgi:hypothetical protein
MRLVGLGFLGGLAATLFSFTTPAWSAVTTNSWTWGGSGFWHHGTNWSMGVPGTNTTVTQIIVSGLAKTILVDTNTPLSNLVVNALIMNSPGSGNSNWLVLSNLNDVGPFRILAGANINGRGTTQSRLILNNSTLICESTNAGTLAVSNATILVNSNSSLLLNNGAQIKIGVGATGALNIATGALVVTDSNFVAGINTNGIGNVVITGGTLDVGWTFTIGEDPRSTGHVVVVSGLLRSVNTNANTEIGQNGGGQLTLSNGVCQFDDVSVGRHDGAHGTFRIFNGLCTGSDLSVGRFTNSYGLFSMAGGQLIFADKIYAGREGTGTVSVTGGNIQARSLVVACTNTAYGNATFSGGTSVFSETLCLGSVQSVGNVTISGGTFVCTNADSTGFTDVILGTFNVSGGNVFLDSVLATNSGAKIVLTGGVVTVDQFTIANGSRLVIGNETNAATVRLGGGTSSFANGLTVSSNATLVGSGVIYGNILNNGTITADTTNTSLLFYGSVTNNRTMIQTNGGTFDFRGPLVNNGTIVPKIFTRDLITSIKLLGTTNELFFGTKTGWNYTLEFKNSLTDLNWMPLGTVAGNDATNSLLDPSVNGLQRFYRIRIE